MAVGQWRGEAEVLLHQDDGQAALLELDQHLAELLHDDRRQAFGDLVEQQQVGTGAQDARHGQHLLLAAGEPRTLAEAALVKVGKHLVELVQAHAAAAHRGRQQQVLLDAQAGEDAPLFRAIADAQPWNLVGRHADGLVAVDHDGAGAAPDHVHDRPQRGGAPGAVAPEQRHQLAAANHQIDTVKDVRLAVKGMQVANAQLIAIHGWVHAWASSSAAASLPR